LTQAGGVVSHMAHNLENRCKSWALQPIFVESNKMILLFNIRITNHRVINYHRAGWLPNYNRADIFKYTLASYKCFESLVSKAIFYIELDPEYAHRQKELEEYIFSLFPNSLVRWQRNFYARDWISSYTKDIEHLPDDLIWMAGNEDHPFVDYNLDVLKSGLTILAADENPLSALLYSHWHEGISINAHKKATLTECGNWVYSSWCETSGINIIKKARLVDHFFTRDWGNTPLYRTDCLMLSGYQLIAPIYVPTRELVRHYDAYMHVWCPHDRASPMVIPPGFFENQLRIRYGYNDRKEGWVNVNPLMEYYAANPNGVDVRTTLDKLPMFWNSIEVDINPDANHELLNKARIEHLIRQTHCPMNTWGVPFDDSPRVPPHWYEHHL
jgi:hypothetical protein